MRRRAPKKWPGAALRVLVRATAALLILAVASLSPGGAPTLSAVESRPQEPSQLLVGLVVDGREVDAVDVYYDGSEFLLPLEAFLSLCDCASARTAAGLAVVTPLGTVMFPPTEIISRGGVEHLSEAGLRQRLAVRVAYDSAAFALVIDVPWLGMRRASTSQGPVLQPEARPPAVSLSNVSFGAYYGQRRNADTGSANATVMGRAADGIWRVRYDDTLAGPSAVREYGWLRQWGDDKLLLLGHQRFGLHSLLGSLELTGAQMAWTNAPVQMFGDTGMGGELLPRQLQSTTTINGTGVPAGIAVLRIDDRQIAATVIGLDGYYEFPGVRLPFSRSSRVEVLIYDRQNPTVPVDIQEHTQRASQAMLPGGVAVVQGAFGAAGNPFDPNAASYDGAAGFVQARYGISDRLTLESTVQHGLRGTQVMAGGLVQIGRGLVASVAAAGVGGRFGYSVDIDGVFGGWRMRGRSESMQEGYRFDAAAAETDQWLELTHRNRSGSFEVGVVGQYRRGRGQDVAFVLPLVAWRPSPKFQMRARPDYDGLYRVDALWNPDRSWRLGLSRSRQATTFDVSRALSRGLRMQLVAEMRDDGSNQQAAVVSWYGRGRLSPAVSAGPLLTNGQPGAVLRTQIAVTPGILLGVQYDTYSLLGTSLTDPAAVRDHRVTVSLSGRLGFVGSRVIPGAAMSLRGGAGSVAGRLRIADGYPVDPDELQGITVRVDGRALTRTGRGGRYYVAAVSPGTHRVAFDSEGLPIELTPRDPDRIVEVASGAVTRADFFLDVEFGLAGRVRLGVAPYPGAVVELVDAGGTAVASTVTDRYGLYRFDGVSIGRYTVRLGGELRDVGGMPVRQLELRDDFLFDQDLDIVPSGLERQLPLPAVVEADPAPAPGAVTVPAATEPLGAAGFDLPSAISRSSSILPDLPINGPDLELVEPAVAPRRAAPLSAPSAAADRSGDAPVVVLRASVVEVVTATAPVPDFAEPAGPEPLRVGRLARAARAESSASGAPVAPPPVGTRVVVTGESPAPELAAPAVSVVRRAAPLAPALVPPADLAAPARVAPALAAPADHPVEILVPGGEPHRAAPLRPAMQELPPELQAKILRFMSQVYGLPTLQH